VCCRCSFITDEQIEEAFVYLANRILSRKQVLERKPNVEPFQYNSEFNKLGQRIKELEANGEYFSRELPFLIFERAKAFYNKAQINDWEYNTEKMKHAFTGLEPLQEFDRELFLKVIKQITIHANRRLSFEFINGLILDSTY